MAVLEQKFLTQPSLLGESISYICKEVDSAIKKVINRQTESYRLQESIAYALLKGGKRFRPLLIKASGDLFNIPFNILLPIAVAVEMMHAYSLVHDDLPAMDNSDMRRGQPSCWKQFDEATAILTGDALLTLAFEIIASAPLPPQICLELINKFAKACGANGMVAGQILDINQEHKNDLHKIEHLQRLKTGELIAFCCEVGAIVAEANSEHKQQLKEAGYKFGLIYQMIDDLLDLKGNIKSIGKPVNQDTNKATIVSLLGEEKALEMIKFYQIAIKDTLKSFNEGSQLFEEILPWISKREN